MKILQMGALTATMAGLGWAQTQVDLRTQGKDVDFSAASFTRPVKTGVVLPATCGVGELFFKSDARAGQNIYQCQSTNTWTQQLNSGGGGGSDFTGSIAVTSAFSATATFSLADVNVRSPVIFQPAIMSANITAVTFTNLSAGAQFSILWLQAPSGGPYTVTYGASVSSTYPACQVTPTANGWALQSFKVLADGTTVIGTGCIGSDQGISIPGSTSGQIQIKVAAAAGSNVLTLPAGTTDFSATGGVSQVVKQTSAGGALTVGRLGCADLSDSGAGCSGSGGGGTFPLITGGTYYEYEFFGSGECTPNERNIGKLGWFIQGNSTVCQPGTATSVGGVLLSTGATSGTDSNLALSPANAVFPFHTASTFTNRFSVRAGTADTNTIYMAGFGDVNYFGGSAPMNGVYIEKQAADTQWFGVCRTAGTQTRSSALTSVTTSQVAFQIRLVSSGTIGFKTASTVAGLASASEVTVTSNCPSVAATFSFSTLNSAAANKTLFATFWDDAITGLGY
jgi:hypothetical protein